MKRIIITIMLLCLILVTSCNKADTSYTITPTIESSSIYTLKLIDKEEIYKIIDALYLGEPKVGDTTTQIYHRVRDHIQEPCNGYCIYEDNDICIEYGNITPEYHDGIGGKDNVCKIVYNGYTLEYQNKRSTDIKVTGNKPYDEDLPGLGVVVFHIYDESRANELYGILGSYINNKYPNTIKNANNKDNGYASYVHIYNEKDYYAATNMRFDEKIKCWTVIYVAKFFPISPANKELEASSKRAATSTTTTEPTIIESVDPYEDGVYH